MRLLLGLGAFRNAFLLRGAGAWIGVRMMAALARLGDLNALQEGFVLLLVGLLVVLDARRRDEDLFLANLGIPSWPVALLGAAGALPLELLVP